MANEFGRYSGHAIVLALGPAEFDHNVLAVYITSFLQTLAK
jgi:hypothetical protein